MPTPLDQEIRFYNDTLIDWLTRFRDRFVLVKGGELIGVYNTNSEALAEGARRFGLQSFLVRQVQEQQPDVYIPALALGILRADYPHPGPSARHSD